MLIEDVQGKMISIRTIKMSAFKNHHLSHPDSSSIILASRQFPPKKETKKWRGPRIEPCGSPVEQQCLELHQNIKTDYQISCLWLSSLGHAPNKPSWFLTRGCRRTPVCWRCPHPRTRRQTAISWVPKHHTAPSPSGSRCACRCRVSSEIEHIWGLKNNNTARFSMTRQTFKMNKQRAMKWKNVAWADWSTAAGWEPMLKLRFQKCILVK